MDPLEVMLDPYLNRSGFCKGKVCGRAIKGAMIQLAMRQIRMKGPKLSVRPTILLCGKSIDKVGGAGGKGALRKFRGDY